MTRLRSASAVPLALCLIAAAAPLPRAQSVPLDYAVAKDAHLVIHGVASRTPDPGLVAFDKAVARLVESGVHEDLLELATMDLRDEQAQRVRAAVRGAFDLLGRVDWSDLMAREVVFVEQVAMPMPEYTLICRVPEDQVAKHLADLRGMLEGFAQMLGAERAAVEEVGRQPGAAVTLAIQGAPVAIAAGAAGDVVVVSTSARAVTSALRRLQSQGAGSLHLDEGFQRSAQEVPASTEGTVYVDVDGLMTFVGQMLQFASGAAGRDAEAGPMVALCRALVEELDVIDHVLVSTVSDGETVTDTTLVRFKPELEGSPLAELSSQQQPWTDWHRLVPADATGFAFDSGFDVGAAFDWLEGLAVDSFGGRERAPWADSPQLACVREVLGHVSGESACVTFPRAGEAGCALGEMVVLLRLDDADGVSAWLREQLSAFAGYARGRGQEVEVTSQGDLHEVRIAALPWIRPVVGVRDGMIWAATSKAAVEQIARVQRGEAPDVRAAERFARLGLESDGHYVDYQQLDASLGGFCDLMGAVGFGLSMLPEDRDTRPAIRLGSIVVKLAAVLRELDLSLDTGTCLLPSPSPDAALLRTVTRYR